MQAIPTKISCSGNAMIKFFAIGHKIIRCKVGGKSMSVIDTDHTGECNLPDYRESLDRKDDKKSAGRQAGQRGRRTFLRDDRTRNRQAIR